MCGRWAISKNKKYLWGTYFYWVRDCKAISEVLEYNGDIAMMSSWAQELLDYHFSVLHCPSRMMIDVGSLTRRFGNLKVQYTQVVTLLSHVDRKKRPAV